MFPLGNDKEGVSTNLIFWNRALQVISQSLLLEGGSWLCGSDEVEIRGYGYRDDFMSLWPGVCRQL